MNTTNLLRTILTTILLALSFNVFSSSWSCRHDNNVREIQVVQTTSAAVPCSVVYRKLTEGVEDQVLWTAENDENFCQAKAEELVEKQTSWGWTCVETLSEQNSDDNTTPETTDTESTNNEPAATTEEASTPEESSTSNTATETSQGTSN